MQRAWKRVGGLIAALLFSMSVWAQGQLVNYEYLGVQFHIPDGWVGQENGDGFVMGSNTEPGLILVTTHEYTTLDQLRAEAQQGLMDEGVYLQPSGSVESIAANALGVEMSGQMNGQAAKSYVAGMINPHGAGITIIALTSDAAYGPRYPQLVKQVVSGVVFSQPKQSPMVAQARQALTGTKLTYMDSYYSSDSSGGYVGSSTNIEIDLCRNGRFGRSGRSSTSVQSGGSANSWGNSGGQGRWQITQSGAGQPVLELNYNNGEVGRYELGFQNGKTYLNGNRYYRTDGGC